MIYQSCNKKNFLNVVADFIINNLNDDFSKLKIILPAGFACSQLQKILITKCGSSILPKITTFSTLALEGGEIFKIPCKQIATVSMLEERIILAEIICAYSKLNYNLSQSLSFASPLANLFFEFETNHVDLPTLQSLPDLDQAQYWDMIYDFLNYAFDSWKNKIHSLNKVTRASYQESIFESEIKRLKNNQDESLLLAGITRNNLISDNFIKDVMQLDNSHIILPPNTYLNCREKYKPEDALYKIHELLKLIEHDEKNIKTLDGNSYESTILDKLIGKTTSSIAPKNIDCIECSNIFHEAEYIAIKCLSTIKDNPNSNIAIVTCSQQAKEQYCISLNKHGIVYQDLLGSDILKHNAVSFLLLIAHQLCCKFDSKILFSFLSHPILSSEQTQEIQRLVRTHTKMLFAPDDVLDLIHKYGDNNLNEYYNNIHGLVFNKLNSHKFNYIFRKTIKIAELLEPNLWKKYPDIALSFSNISQMKWNISLDDIEDFPKLLKQIITGGRLISKKQESNIILCKPFETTLINYDLMIITDLNESIYPYEPPINPWINKTMQSKLSLDNSRANFGIQLYEFYLNLQNKQILLTRSKKQTSSKEIPPSPFILQLKHIMGENLKQHQLIYNTPNVTDNQKDSYAVSKHFPKQISATDIETLIRTPYNFYAKKILGLYKLDEIDDQPNLAEFGNFFHLVAEKYTKNNIYTTEAFINISKSVLDTTNIPNYSRVSWLTRLTAIAPEFVEFDKENRIDYPNIYSEIKGSIEINIVGQKIRVTAIADRISVNKLGTAVIIDYKTGAIPTKKEILSGLSPQLLVESIILMENGFPIKVNDISKMVYVKINSNAPYVKITEIPISKSDILKHKKGMISLIEHYIQNKSFAIQPNLLKYDDYAHLARRM